MIRLGTLFWLVLVAAAGSAMFAVKYHVQAIEHALVQTEKATIAEQHQMRVLEAEWAYLNRPATLAQMNERFLSLVPITTKELRTSLADLPMRPAPAEKTAPAETLVAANAPPQPRNPSDRLSSGAAAVTAAATAAARPRAVIAIAHAHPPAPKRLAMARLGGQPKSLDELIARIVASR